MTTMITAEELKKRQENIKKQDVDKQLELVSLKLEKMSDSLNTRIVLEFDLYPEVLAQLKANGYKVYMDQTQDWVIEW